MADKSKNFGNKVANFGKKFIGGLLFDDLPEAAEVSEADRLEYPLHDTQDYKSCIEFGTIQEEGVDLEGLIGFGSLFGKNETIEDESDEDKANREKKESEAKQKQEDAAKIILESQDNVDSTQGKDDAVSRNGIACGKYNFTGGCVVISGGLDSFIFLIIGLNSDFSPLVSSASS